MKRLLISVFFVTYFIQLSAQQVNIDSLQLIWNNQSESDTNRLNAMHKIAWNGYVFTNPDSAFYFAQKQYDFAKKKKLPEYMAKALNTQGVSFYIKSDYDKAIEFYNKSLKIRKKIGDKKGVAMALNNIGIILMFQGNYAQAVDNYTYTLKINEELKDKEGMASAYVNIGIIHDELGDAEKALGYYQKSLKLFEELENKKGISSCLFNIGVIYKNKGDYQKAINLYNRMLTIAEEANDKAEIADSYFNMGHVYQRKGDDNVALDYYNKSLKIYQDLNIKRGIAAAFHNIGNLYKNRKEYNKAANFAKQSLEMSKEINHTVRIKEAHFLQWETYKAMGEYKKALFAYENYVSERDSLESDKNQKEVIRQEFKYNYEKKAVADSIKSIEAAKIKDAELAVQIAKNAKQKQQNYFLYGGLMLALLFGGFIFNRFKVTSKQKNIIEEQKNTVDRAFDELEEKNQEIMDSIAYAKRIQSAILPPQKLVKTYLEQSFILYKPKDIVAGDFYWMEHKDGKVLFAAADCTGHGVPGAMVSVICNNGLNRSVREYGLTNPGKILDKTREIVVQEFEKSEEEVKDGMDIALCSLEFLPAGGAKLQYAGAHNPLWLVREKSKTNNKDLVENKERTFKLEAFNYELYEVKANKQPIGKFDNPQPYTSHSIELMKGDTIYIFSDGYIDQFGGEKGKKFKARAFRELLLSIQTKNMMEQREVINQNFEKWKGNLEQIDDVCVIGVRV